MKPDPRLQAEWDRRLRRDGLALNTGTVGSARNKKAAQARRADHGRARRHNTR